MGEIVYPHRKNAKVAPCLGLPRFKPHEREHFDLLLNDIQHGINIEGNRLVIMTFFEGNQVKQEQIRTADLMTLENEVKKVRNARGGCTYDFNDEVRLLPEKGMWRLKCPKCSNSAVFIKGDVKAHEEDKTVWKPPYWL